MRVSKDVLTTLILVIFEAFLGTLLAIYRNYWFEILLIMIIVVLVGVIFLINDKDKARNGEDNSDLERKDTGQFCCTMLETGIHIDAKKEIDLGELRSGDLVWIDTYASSEYKATLAKNKIRNSTSIIRSEYANVWNVGQRIKDTARYCLIVTVKDGESTTLHIHVKISGNRFYTASH